MKLNVFLLDNLVGYLYTTADRGIVFSYDEKYLSTGKVPLSLSLPLQQKEFSQKECLPYFSGLLPEGTVKSRISQYLQISESSTMKFLQFLGGECSGTVSFIDSNESEFRPKNTFQLSDENYIPLTDEGLLKIVKESKNKPMLLGSKDLRLSLAGAQEKISLAYYDESWHIPKNGAPSTHILKPTREGELNSIAYNEFFCMNLADLMGLPVPKTSILDLCESQIFVCERYDRKFDAENKIILRIHQEDFCQALGIMNDIKYQADGGPSYKNCLDLITNKFSDKIVHINIFLKAILFNYLIGNCDSHGKNFSLLFDGSKIVLSPFYDLLSTTVYNSLTKKMAMKLGSNYEIEKISRSDFFKQAEIFEIKNRFWVDVIDEFSKKIFLSFDKVASKKEFAQKDELLETLYSQIKSRIEKINL